MPWAEHDRLVSLLFRGYNEVLTAVAVADATPVGKGYLMEIYTSPDSPKDKTNTFTAIVTRPDGCSMPLISGHAFEIIKRVKPSTAM